MHIDNFLPVLTHLDKVEEISCLEFNNVFREAFDFSSITKRCGHVKAIEIKCSHFNASALQYLKNVEKVTS